MCSSDLRDLEQMSDRRLVVLAVQVRSEFVGREPTEFAEELAQVAVGTMELLGDGVHLGAVAGRQHDGLADVRTRHQSVDRLGDRMIGDRHALEKCEGTSAVVHPENDDRHGGYLIASTSASTLRARTRDGPQSGAILLVIAQNLQFEIGRAHV